MKRLSTGNHQSILEAIGPLFRSEYGEAALEKDIHLTDAIRAIVSSDFGSELVLCGGTSLSKAFGAINRMSEDLDFKVALEPGRSKTAIRSFMGEVRESLIQTMRNLDFEVSDDGVSSRSENHNINVQATYDAVFPRDHALRAYIQIELMAEIGPIRSIPKQIETLVWRELGSSEEELLVPCLTLEQTAAEKIVSFLRRYGAYLEKGHFDRSLVRHIFDVHALINANLISIEKIREVLSKVLVKDAQHFGDVPAGFAFDSRGTLMRVLDSVQFGGLKEEHWPRFVENLVAGPAPSFDEALETFSRVARSAFS